MSETVRKRRSDGERSRSAILREAAQLATVEGIAGLSIGRLAEAVGMSKSGLFAHFGSKEELQLATVETANAVFLESFKLPWFATLTTVVVTEVPEYLLGQKTLDQLIGDMRTTAENGIKGVTTTATSSATTPTVLRRSTSTGELASAASGEHASKKRACSDSGERLR